MWMPPLEGFLGPTHWQKALGRPSVDGLLMLLQSWRVFLEKRYVWVSPLDLSPLKYDDYSASISVCVCLCV